MRPVAIVLQILICTHCMPLVSNDADVGDIGDIGNIGDDKFDLKAIEAVSQCSFYF